MATIRGDVTDDFLTGTAEDDAIFGVEGDDTLSGNAGRDSLFGGPGNDRLYGGDQQDLLDGGSGFDIVDYAGSGTQALRVDLAAGEATFPGQPWPSEVLVEIEGAAGADGSDILIGAAGGNYLYGRGGVDSLRGGAGADEMIGGYGADFLSGEAGSDTLRGTEAWDGRIQGDTLDGGDGFDFALYDKAEAALIVDLTRGRVAVEGSDGVDTIRAVEAVVGGEFGDRVAGNTAANRLEGGSGADTLIGGGGGDTLIGGAGDDLLWGQGATDLLDGGEGIDIAIYRDRTTAVRVDLAAGTASFPGQPLAPESLVSIEGAEGGSAGDVLIGDGGANRIAGGGGIDRLLGGEGEDTLDGGAGGDTLDGGAGRDVASYASVAASVTVDLGDGTAFVTTQPEVSDILVSIEAAEGGRGDDLLIGTAGAEGLAGGAGDDSGFGGGGDDTLDGGLGNDTLHGGGGGDSFRAGPIATGYRAGVPVLADDGGDLIDGGDGADTVVVRDIAFTDAGTEVWGTIAVRINLADGTIRWSDGELASTRGSLAAIENVATGDGSDIVVGTGGANRINAGGGANRVFAGEGDDTVAGGTRINDDVEGLGDGDSLYGGGGNDILHGRGSVTLFSRGSSSGSDFLDGGAGDDTLYAGAAFNRMAGGVGADEFHFTDEPLHEDTGGSGLQLAQKNLIEDFGAGGGDTIHIQMIEEPGRPIFVGETDTVEDGEIGYRRVQENGVTHTLVEMAVGYSSLEDDLYRIRLVGYAGPLSGADFFFT